MSTGADYSKQNAEQVADETFSGKAVDVAKAAPFNPALDAGHGERTESTPNDK